MNAIKNWFLEKNGFTIYSIKELQRNGFEIAKETNKAVLVNYRIWDSKLKQMWIPKSCMIDEWENNFSKKAIGKAYHEYLVNVSKKAYYNGELGEQKTFKSGRSIYNQVSFIHQKTIKELKWTLDNYNIQYQTKEEFINAL